MFARSLFRVRSLFVMLVAMIFAVAAYGFAASNTVEVSGAGDGAGVISGYSVTGIRYTLGSPDPSQITAVEFTLSTTSGAVIPANAHVQFGTYNAGPPATLTTPSAWFTCPPTEARGSTFKCTGITGVLVAPSTGLRVVAAQ